ncbi:hypothetical protein L249_4905, partial [Ophiocordyceps polyrhachis-furcata BCC 54312]
MLNKKERRGTKEEDLQTVRVNVNTTISYSKGYTSKKKKRNHVGKPSFFYRQFLRNKDLYVRTLPRCKRCAQGGVGTDQAVFVV